MKRFRTDLLLFLTFLTILFFLPFLPLMASSTTDNEDFELIVIGTLSGLHYFGPPPIPPNYTTASSITWDLAGNYELIFRLNYYGSSPIKIVQLLLWQEATEFGITWNVTAPTLITPPLERLVKNAFYEFTVKGLFYAETITYSKITLENHQEVLISIQTPWNISYLPSWTFSSRVNLSSPIEYLVFFAVASSVLLLHRKRKLRSRNTND